VCLIQTEVLFCFGSLFSFGVLFCFGVVFCFGVLFCFVLEFCFVYFCQALLAFKELLRSCFVLLQVDIQKYPSLYQYALDMLHRPANAMQTWPGLSDLLQTSNAF
jgi:hypothetical protein